MDLSTLISIAKRGWDVTIATKISTSNESTTLLAIADKRSLSKNVQIDVQNGQVSVEQLWSVVSFLNTVNLLESDQDPLPELLLAILPIADSPPQPGGSMLCVPNPDGGWDIKDDQDTVVGHVPGLASIGEGGKVVVSAIASQAADGLISQPSNVQDALSIHMEKVAAVADDEIDSLIRALGSMGDSTRPMSASPSADQLRSFKVQQTMDRQIQLFSDVDDKLISKGFPKNRLMAEDLQKLCQARGLTFRFASSESPSNVIDRYRIVDSKDPDNEVAAGTLTSTFFRRDQPYLKQEDVIILKKQLLAAPDGISEGDLEAFFPATLDDIRETEKAVVKFREDHPNGVTEDDQTKKEEKKGSGETKGMGPDGDPGK